MTVGTQKKNFNLFFAVFGLHGFYRGPISDNGTSNARKSPLLTELTTLGSIFGIRRHNCIRITLLLKKIWLKLNITLVLGLFKLVLMGRFYMIRISFI